MKKCDSECPAICDFCIHYDFGGKVVGNSPEVYVGHGWCYWHQKRKEPHDSCIYFYCENIEDEM